MARFKLRHKQSDPPLAGKWKTKKKNMAPKGSTKLKKMGETEWTCLTLEGERKPLVEDESALRCALKSEEH